MKEQKLIKYEKFDKVYEYTVERADCFCPSCKSNDVWVDRSEGDFYDGPEHFCLSCNLSFAIKYYGKLRFV